MSTDSPIEAYLDALFLRLPRDPQQARRLLAEAEDHLRESAQVDVQRGVEPVEAERRAVQRFGPVDAVAWNPRPSVVRVGTELLGLVWSLASAGLVAIGVSGIVVSIMNLVAGREFVGGTGDGIGYPAATCGHLLKVQPTAGDCARAAVLENSDDAVVLRLLAGGVGLLMLAGYLVWRRRRRGPSVLSAQVPPTIAVCLFGAAAAALLGVSVGAVPIDTRQIGVGFFLSGGLVAAVAAAGYAAQLILRLREVQPVPSRN